MTKDEVETARDVLSGFELWQQRKALTNADFSVSKFLDDLATQRQIQAYEEILELASRTSEDGLVLVYPDDELGEEVRRILGLA
jgi:hypothetical protein